MAGITIKDIARESGYSIGTVSRALNAQPGVSPAAREAILNTARKYDFQLNPNAKFLKQRTRRGVHIVIRGYDNIMFALLLEALTLKLSREGVDFYVSYLKETEDEVAEALRMCRERMPEAILFLGSSTNNLNNGMSQLRVPCILVTNSAKGLPYDNLSSVAINDEQAASFAVDYLLGLGHEKIGMIGGYAQDSRTVQTRLQGAAEAFEKKGLNFDFEDLYEEEFFSIQGGYIAMDRLLSRHPDLDAVFILSDMMALGAMRAAADRGYRIPEDLSVLGFDGLALSAYSMPRLTTISQNPDQLANKTAEVLQKVLSDPSIRILEEIPFAFVDGESTASAH